MTFLQNIAQADTTIELTTRKEHQDIVGLLERWLDHFSKTSEIFEGYTTKGEDFYFLTIWTLSFNTAISVCDRLLKGYYTQAATLLRSLYEQWVRFRYCVLHPEMIEKLRAGKGPKVTDMQTEIRKEFSEPESNLLKEGYKTLSDFAHGDILALLDTMVSEEQSNALRIGGWYKKETFMLLAPATARFMGLIQLEFGFRFKEPLDGDQIWVQNLFELLNETTKLIQE